MKNVRDLLKMKMLDVKMTFFFTFMFISVSFVNAQKEIKPVVIQDYRIQEVKRQNERLQQQIDSLRIEVEKTKIGTEYFNTLFDNQNYSYSFIITGFAIILGLVALFSWGIFWQRVSTVEKKLEEKFNGTIQKHKEEENKFLEMLDLRQHESKIFVSNLSLIIGELFDEELSIVLWCNLNALDEYTKGHYDSLLPRVQNNLIQYKVNKLSVLEARLASINELCNRIIDKGEILPNFVQEKMNMFTNVEFYIDSENIKKYRIDITYKINKLIEKQKDKK